MMKLQIPPCYHAPWRNCFRDGYVKILTQNIQSSMVYNFEKMNLYQIDLLKAKYDTCSVMHYNAYAFTKVRLIL